MREDKRIVYNGEVMAFEYFAKKVMLDLNVRDEEIETLKKELNEVKREKRELLNACWEEGKEKRVLEDALRESKRVVYETGIERDAYANALKKTQERCDEMEMELRSLWNGMRSEEKNE